MLPGKGEGLSPSHTFPYCTLQVSCSQPHHVVSATDVIPPSPISSALAEMSPQEIFPSFCDSTFPSAPQKPSLETFIPLFLTITSRIRSQTPTAVYFSAEESPVVCAPHHPFISASWPQSINSLWKAAGLRTPSPRSTWLKPLNDQLGMSHISSPSPGNPARPLCTGLK